MPTRMFCYCLATLLVGLISATSVAAVEKIDLSGHISPGRLTVVSADLEVGGMVRLRDQQQASAEIRELPMSVVASLQYEEQRLPFVRREAVAEPIARSIRHYLAAEATIKVGESGATPKLSDEARKIVVESTTGRPLLYAPDAPLDREQLDLIDVIGNTLIINALLPTEPVAEGDTWDQSEAVMAGLLGLDSVAVCHVQSILSSFNSQYAQVRFTGTVHGMADGAATEIEVRGIYLFERQQQQITRLNLAVKELRSVGDVSPGLDSIAKLKLAIDPLDQSSHLTKAVNAALRSSSRQAVDVLQYHATTQGFQLRHDRQWFVTSEQRETVTLRRVDQGDLIAQCTITRLPPKSAGRQTTLEQFEKDIRYSLGESFQQLVSSRQWTSSEGLNCCELVVRGAIEELPVEWHYYLVAPEAGHRVSVAVTIEGPKVQRLGDADRSLIDSIQLLPDQTPTAQRSPASQIR